MDKVASLGGKGMAFQDYLDQGFENLYLFIFNRRFFCLIEAVENGAFLDDEMGLSLAAPTPAIILGEQFEK